MTAVARMVLAHALVPTFVVARQPSHELLGVAIFNVDEEACGDGTAQHGGGAAMMRDLDLAVIADHVGEALRQLAHASHLVPLLPSARASVYVRAGAGIISPALRSSEFRRTGRFLRSRRVRRSSAERVA